MKSFKTSKFGGRPNKIQNAKVVEFGQIFYNKYTGEEMREYFFMYMVEYHTLTWTEYASLAEKITDMSATCRRDSQMSAHLAKMPLSWRNKIDPT